jgi:hypothetical protein
MALLSLLVASARLAILVAVVERRDANERHLAACEGRWLLRAVLTRRERLACLSHRIESRMWSALPLPVPQGTPDVTTVKRPCGCTGEE